MIDNNAQIENIYFRAKNIVGSNKEFINSLISNTKFEYSCKVLVNKSKVIRTLIESCEELNDARSYYSICVLMRCAIENYLLSEFVFTNARISKTDKIGIGYFNEYYGAEFLKRESYNLNLQEKIDKIRNEDKEKLFDVILKKYPVFGNVLKTEHAIQNAYTFYNLFKEINMIEYFHHGKTNEIIDDIQNEIFKQLAQKYNFLSSYVHGGPTSEIESLNILSKPEKEIKNKEHIEYMKVFYPKIVTNLFLLLFESTQDIALPIFIKEINGDPHWRENDV